MFPVSLNPYFNPTLSFAQSPFTHSPFINPELAMRAYASAWDPYSAQAYYRGAYPNFGSFGTDPTSLLQHIVNNPVLQHSIHAGSQVPGSQQNAGAIGVGSPSTSQSQMPIGFVPQTGQSQVPLGFSPSTQSFPFSPSTQSFPTTSPFAFGPAAWLGHLSPSELGFAGQASGNYLSPEFQEFIRAELLRTGKAIRSIGSALENDNEQVKSQAQVALTAQFFYALGLLYTRGVIIPRDVPGASSRSDEVSPTVAAESFGESLERFAREPIQFRSNTLGELIEKARLCFRTLATEGEQLERFKEDRFKIEKKRVTA
jgi:hypothetical protein